MLLLEQMVKQEELVGWEREYMGWGWKLQGEEVVSRWTWEVERLDEDFELKSTSTTD